jgi:hypothetical protein
MSLPRQPLRPLPRKGSACRDPASRRRTVSTGSIVWTTTASAGSWLPSKCWFLAAEGIAKVKKRVHHHAAKGRVAAASENETAWRKQEALVDARAELPRSAPATSQPIAASKLKVVDAAIGAAALVPSAPDQLTPDHPTQRQVDVETLLAAAPAASDGVALSVAPTSPVPIAEAADDGRGLAANGLGLMLMALGLVSVLSSSRTVREAMLLRD